MLYFRMKTVYNIIVAGLPLKRAKLPHALRQANTPHRA